MTIADDRCVNKCRVRIAHAALTFLGAAAFLRKIKRVRVAHPTTVRILRCHSRAGGNPWGMWRRVEHFLADAKWIPAYAGMTGWGAGPGWPWARAIGQPSATIQVKWQTAFADTPGEGLSMGLSRHALPRVKREMAAGEASKKCRVDQVWHKDKCCHQERIHRSSILRDLACDKSKSCRGLGGWPKATLGHLRGTLIDPTDDTIARIYPATDVPRNRPFTLRSSSALDQWMPSPSPNSSQSARCSGDARRRRGNQANGAEMRRPSARTTVNSSSVTSTCRARGLYSTAKELMPLLQKNLFVIRYQPHKLAQLIRGKTTRRRQGNWLEPELGEGAITLYMDVRWLTAFITIKEEPIRADAIQGWHFACQFVVIIESDYTLRWNPENVCVTSRELQ